jgi:hypothetical protein
VSTLSPYGSEWERVHPGLYTCGDRTITRTGTQRWELEGMVIDSSTHRSLRKAMLASDHT